MTFRSSVDVAFTATSFFAVTVPAAGAFLLVVSSDWALVVTANTLLMAVLLAAKRSPLPAASTAFPLVFIAVSCAVSATVTSASDSM